MRLQQIFLELTQYTNEFFTILSDHRYTSFRKNSEVIISSLCLQSSTNYQVPRLQFSCLPLPYMPPQENPVPAETIPSMDMLNSLLRLANKSMDKPQHQQCPRSLIITPHGNSCQKAASLKLTLLNPVSYNKCCHDDWIYGEIKFILSPPPN